MFYPCVDYHFFYYFAPILYGIGVALLVYLLMWGKLTANVKSWIHIGTFQFQPSEFMKIFTALMLARFFENYTGSYLSLQAFLKAMGVVAAPVFLILLAPDSGTAATIFRLLAVVSFF